MYAMVPMAKIHTTSDTFFSEPNAIEGGKLHNVKNKHRRHLSFDIRNTRHFDWNNE